MVKNLIVKFLDESLKPKSFIQGTWSRKYEQKEEEVHACVKVKPLD